MHAFLACGFRVGRFPPVCVPSVNAKILVEDTGGTITTEAQRRTEEVEESKARDQSQNI